MLAQTARRAADANAMMAAAAKRQQFDVNAGVNAKYAACAALTNKMLPAMLAAINNACCNLGNTNMLYADGAVLLAQCIAMVNVLRQWLLQ